MPRSSLSARQREFKSAATSVAISLAALLLLMLVLVGLAQSSGTPRGSNVSLANVTNELAIAVLGSPDWCPGPPPRSCYHILLITLSLSAKGLLIGVLLSSLVGLILGFAPNAATRVVEALNAIRAIPLTLLTVGLALLPSWTRWPPVPAWLGFDRPDKEPALLIALGCFSYLAVGWAEGVGHRDRDREAFCRYVLKMSPTRYLCRVLLWEVAPPVLAALRVSLLFAFVLSIVFEQLLNYPGVGLQVWNWMNESGLGSSEGGFPEAKIVAMIVIVAATGMLADGLFAVAKHHLLRWRPSGV